VKIPFKIKNSKFTILLLSAAMLLSLTACNNMGKKDSKYAGAGGDGDFVNGTALPERQEGVSFTSSNVDRSRFRPVHFGFDSYAIESSEQPLLDEVAGFLKSGSNSIIIAGFTDERGTAEYNRGLGERRAQAVRDYLIKGGADGSKLQTVSFGADMPADAGSGESAWAKNRRAEFGVVR
jgi:peptidoglycan-associated lipoprotein